MAVYYFSPLEAGLASFGTGLANLGGMTLSLLIIAISYLVGVWAAGAVSSPEDPDPRRVVWDEFVGMWVTCLFLPKRLFWLAIAFVVFRVMDVVKPFPIRRLERLPRGWGIMTDDLLAGGYGAILCNFLFRLALDFAVRGMKGIELW